MRGLLQRLIRYMAPEILKSDKYNGRCVDLFAIGVILYFLVTNTVPFSKADVKEQNYKNIYNNKSETFWKNKAKGKSYIELTKNLKELLVYLFSYDPIERPSLSEKMSHEWYNKPIPTHEEITVKAFVVTTLMKCVKFWSFMFLR